MARTERMKELIRKVDSFLEGYSEGDELKLSISPNEKIFLEDYVLNHPKGGVDFYFRLGLIKTGLERDFRLCKKI